MRRYKIITNFEIFTVDAKNEQEARSKGINEMVRRETPFDYICVHLITLKSLKEKANNRIKLLAKENPSVAVYFFLVDKAKNLKDIDEIFDKLK